jgi:hypothetical protein
VTSLRKSAPETNEANGMMNVRTRGSRDELDGGGRGAGESEENEVALRLRERGRQLLLSEGALVAFRRRMSTVEEAGDMLSGGV